MERVDAERLNDYRSLVEMVLSAHAELAPTHGNVESIPIFDRNADNYLLVDLGWEESGRAYGVALHVRLVNGKIWIERDGTEEGIANEFVQLGVPKEQIVLAFYRPERRRITDFAAA